MHLDLLDIYKRAYGLVSVVAMSLITSLLRLMLMMAPNHTIQSPALCRGRKVRKKERKKQAKNNRDATMHVYKGSSLNAALSRSSKPFLP